jgi:hypothetical protein
MGFSANHGVASGMAVGNHCIQSAIFSVFIRHIHISVCILYERIRHAIRDIILFFNPKPGFGQHLKPGFLVSKKVWVIWVSGNPGLNP